MPKLRRLSGKAVIRVLQSFGLEIFGQKAVTFVYNALGQMVRNDASWWLLMAINLLESVHCIVFIEKRVNLFPKMNSDRISIPTELS